MRSEIALGSARPTGLVDLLDRVLDKGLVIAGDIKVSLADVELLTIRIRLIVCSLDKATEIGLDWWQHDRYFSHRNTRRVGEEAKLRRELRLLQRKLALLQAPRSRRGLFPSLKRSQNHRRRASNAG